MFDYYGAFEKFFAIKLFYTKNYNILTYGLSVNKNILTKSWQHYEKTSKGYFLQVAQTFPDGGCTWFFINNFMNNFEFFPYNFKEDYDKYLLFLNYNKTLLYSFKTDCENISKFAQSNNIAFNDVFNVIDNKMPVVLQLWKRGFIRYETIILLDSYINFIDNADKKIEFNLMWDKIKVYLLKTKSMMVFDSKQIEEIICKCLKI